MDNRVDTADVGEYLANIAKDAALEDLTGLDTDHHKHPCNEAECLAIDCCKTKEQKRWTVN